MLHIFRFIEGCVCYTKHFITLLVLAPEHAAKHQIVRTQMQTSKGETDKMQCRDSIHQSRISNLQGIRVHGEQHLCPHNKWVLSSGNSNTTNNPNPECTGRHRYRPQMQKAQAHLNARRRGDYKIQVELMGAGSPWTGDRCGTIRPSQLWKHTESSKSEGTDGNKQNKK